MLVWLTSTAEISYAQGEHGRRAGAELQVLIGDVRYRSKLAAANENSLVQSGLDERIRGSLSALDILFRLADQEADRDSRSYLSLLRDAYSLVAESKWTELVSLLAKLEDRFPLLQLSYPKSESLLKSSRDLHQRFCAACHDTPAQQVQRPAYNLFQQSKSVSEVEFFARMLIGVRGDRVTGIDNPFSDAEIAGLIHLYQSDDVD